MNSYKLFTPGRLCLFGEHSDWAGLYRAINADIAPGIAIVAPTNEGIYATVFENSDRKLIVEFNDKSIEVELDFEKLVEIAQSDNFFSYICGTAAAIMREFSVFFENNERGLKITIDEMTLPIKSGLSSSASICVLTVRAFSKVFDFSIGVDQEMDLAYHGERQTNSRCGRLDQALAFGRPAVVNFDNEDIKSNEIVVSNPIYLVYANLNASKDTVKILSDLNNSYPFAKNELEKNVQTGLGENNRKIVNEAIIAIENADAKTLGELMIKAQKNFDQFVAPASDELKSPKLHSVLSDAKVSEYSYGGKGVGSQGDGSIQFVAKSENDQKKLVDHLNSIGLSAYSLTIAQSHQTKTTSEVSVHQQSIKKAIIPAAGYGTRMFPLTKILKKEFLPILSDGLAKPAILVLMEELLECGIEEICVVASDLGIQQYKNFFNDNLSEDNYNKLPLAQKKCYENIIRLRDKITYVRMNEEVSFGYSVFAAKEFTQNQSVLLCLSDQVYQSKNEISATEQFLSASEKNGVSKPLVSVEKIKVEECEPYGIVFSDEENQDVFEVKKFIEKPTVEFAKKNLSKDGFVFRIFGQYILTPETFELLPKSDFSITKALESQIGNGLFAMIPNASMHDIGTPQAYFQKEDHN